MKKIILAVSGIGKIQSAIAASHLINNYNFDKIINIGIAGNIKGNIYQIGDVFLPEKIIQADIYLPFEWTHLDYAKKSIELNSLDAIKDEKFEFNVWDKTVCVSQDIFVDNKKLIDQLQTNYQADICEMESFAIASVLREYSILDKLIVVKSISDWANSFAIDDHMDNLELAMINGIKVLESIIW